MSPKAVSTSVRGIGVAVSTSMSTASPLRASASRWCTPKRCCSSTMASARSRNATSSWNSAWVPTRRSISPMREALQRFGALLAALASGQDGDANAGLFRKRRDGGEMLARQDFGRRHQRRLAAGLDHGRGGKQRHHRLAGADIALQQADHALRLGEIGDDVVHGAALRGRQRIGQCRDDLGAQQAFARAAAAGQAALVGANQRERELTGEQLVVGEARPCRAVGQHVAGLGRMMQRFQRVGEGRKVCALAPGVVLPFRQLRQLRQRAVGRLAHLVERQPFGQRIDRLDHRQLVELGLADHAVRMHHLQHAVVERGGARDVAQLARREELFEIIAPGVEIGQRQRAGVVMVSIR